jgi:hypothetical protein
VLTTSSRVTCPHQATATHVPSQVRVLAGGSPVLTQGDQNVVAGCPFTLPNGTPSPCLSIRWLVPALRVRVGGRPALLETSAGLCHNPQQVPQGPPTVLLAEPRVAGQ